MQAGIELQFDCRTPTSTARDPREGSLTDRQLAEMETMTDLPLISVALLALSVTVAVAWSVARGLTGPQIAQGVGIGVGILVIGFGVQWILDRHGFDEGDEP